MNKDDNYTPLINNNVAQKWSAKKIAIVAVSGFAVAGLASTLFTSDDKGQDITDL